MSFGKLFTSCFSGSMMGAGADVFAVWAYVVSNTMDSHVELNPELIASIIGMPVPNVEAAIVYLCSPDPKSRNQEREGRRLIKVGQFSYHVVSHKLYRAMNGDHDLRRHLAPRRPSKPQQENRERLRLALAHARFATDPIALEEWVGLVNEAQVKTLDEGLEFVAMCKERATAKGSADHRYAKQFEWALAEWRYRRTPKPKAKA
jgi:hypothetical protein